MAEKTTRKPTWLVPGDEREPADTTKGGPLREGGPATVSEAPSESHAGPGAPPRTLSEQQTTRLHPPQPPGADKSNSDGFLKKFLSSPSSLGAGAAADPEAAASGAGTAGSFGKRLVDGINGALPTPRSRLMALMTLVMVVGIIIVLHGFGVGSSGEASRTPAAASASGKVAPAAPATSKVVDTGLTFGDLNTKDGKASLEGARLKWDGSVTSGEAGETITLKGPTAVQIRRGFEMPRSSIQSGVFAVAQQGGDVLHVVFNTFQAGDTEITQGSIFAVRDDRLVFSGYYRDERKTASDTVVRTYMPPGGENYRRSFRAPEGTPIPLLVGFKGVDSSGNGSS